MPVRPKTISPLSGSWKNVGSPFAARTRGIPTHAAWRLKNSFCNSERTKKTKRNDCHIWHYRLFDFKARLLGSDTNPEQVNQFHLAQFENGEIDAMFLYLSAAADRGLPYLRLPDEINLSNPALATAYAQVHFT